MEVTEDEEISVTPRRSRIGIIGASIVPILIAAGAFLASRGGGPVARRTPSSTTTAPTVPVSQADETTVGTAANGSLTGLSFLFPKQLPQGMELKSASAAPIGCCPQSAGSFDLLDTVLVTYLSADGKQMLAVQSVRVLEQATPPTTFNPAQPTLRLTPTTARTDRNATVHGFPATLGRYGSARLLTWEENGQSFKVYSSPELTETQVNAFAEGIVPDTRTAAFTSSPPAGYVSRYEGKGFVSPAWAVSLNFEKDKANVSVQIKQLSPTDHAIAELSEKFGSPGFKRVKISGGDGLEFTSTSTVALTWKLTPDVGVMMQTDGLSEEAALAFARSLEQVDETRFRAGVSNKLIVESGSKFPVAGPVVTSTK